MFNGIAVLTPSLAILAFLSALPVHAVATDQFPHTLWLEAESFGPLKGSNFSYQPVAQTTKGSWSVSGPGVAAEWTQGGESEWMSVAARADEPGELAISRDAEVPAAGVYSLWVRYADYRGKKESFGVRMKQGASTSSHVFGNKPVVDELDPMKVTWDWAFGWDHIPVDLKKGPITMELYTTGPTEARRQVDCLCLTTDAIYHPTGREKPDSPSWKLLREMQRKLMADDPKESTDPIAPLDTAAQWKVSTGPPTFLWNIGTPWLDELKKPSNRLEYPFACDPPILKDFLDTFSGKEVPVYGSPLEWRDDPHSALSKCVRNRLAISQMDGSAPRAKVWHPPELWRADLGKGRGSRRGACES